MNHLNVINSDVCHNLILYYEIHEILNFLETFMSHPGKSLKVHFNLFLRILAYESEEKILGIFFK